MQAPEFLQWLNVLAIPILGYVSRLDKRLSRLEMIQELRDAGKLISTRSELK